MPFFSYIVAKYENNEKPHWRYIHNQTFMWLWTKFDFKILHKKTSLYLNQAKRFAKMHQIELTKSEKLPKVYMYEMINLVTLRGLCILDYTNGIFCSVLQRLHLSYSSSNSMRRVATWQLKGVVCSGYDLLHSDWSSMS